MSNGTHFSLQRVSLQIFIFKHVLLCKQPPRAHGVHIIIFFTYRALLKKDLFSLLISSSAVLTIFPRRPRQDVFIDIGLLGVWTFVEAEMKK
jgi:hypothetical protein